jgi:site-specific DNA-methyltransferase (adenine-specific)
MEPYIYYEDAAAVIWHGDCRDVLRQFDANSIDAVITDPPYEAEAHTLARRIKTTGGGGDYGTVGVLALDFDPMTPDLRADCGTEFGRVARGWVLVFCQVEATQTWAQAIAAKYLRTQIWVKVDGQPQLSGDRPGMGYESIVTCWAGEGRSRWNGGGRVGVYQHPTVKRGTGHLTEKPLVLMRQLVSLFSNEGDTIIDPFGGSGTTARACKDLGRRCILVEREERYCAIAARRLSQEVFDLAV